MTIHSKNKKIHKNKTQNNKCVCFCNGSGVRCPYTTGMCTDARLKGVCLPVCVCVC